MRIEFTDTRDRAYALRLFRATLRKNLIFTFLLGGVMTLTGVLTLAATEAWAMLGGAVALGLGTCWLIKPFILPTQLVNRLPASWYLPRSYVLTDDFVEWRTELSLTRLDWALVARVQQRPDTFVLVQGGGLANWDIPRAGLSTEQESELITFLMQRRLLGGASPPTAGRPGPGTAARLAESAAPPADKALPVVRRPTP